MGERIKLREITSYKKPNTIRSYTLKNDRIRLISENELKLLKNDLKQFNGYVEKDWLGRITRSIIKSPNKEIKIERKFKY